MSKFLDTLLDEAHVDYLNNGFDECIRKLKSIKLRINDTSLLGRMQKKENDTDQEYQMRWTKIQSSDDIEYVNKLMALKRWKSEEYMTFYNRINSEIP